MRHASHDPSRQLRSVAMRYCSELAAGWASASSAAVTPPGRVADGHARARGAVRGGQASGSAEDRDSNSQHRDPDLARLEAVLLLARDPVNSRKLAQFANLADGTQARTLVRRLNEHYDAAGRAFRVEQVAGGFQLLTRRKFAPWLRRLAHVPGESRLSAPALETLAVIAYRQPVPRADIEAVRGVNCGEILRQLLERDLVRIGGRSEELGRPFLYATTKRFLRIFGLVHLDDLPSAQELHDSPLPEAWPTIPHDKQPTEDEPESAAETD